MWYDKVVDYRLRLPGIIEERLGQGENHRNHRNYKIIAAPLREVNCHSSLSQVARLVFVTPSVEGRAVSVAEASR